jgi:hypothetical protein
MKAILVNNTSLSIVVGILVFVELVDLYINRTYLIHRSSLSIENELFVFVVLQIIFIISQLFLFKYVSVNALMTHRKSSTTRISTLTVLFSQLSLISIIAVIIIQMIAYQSYDLIFIIISLWISYLLAIAMLLILCYRFFLWLQYQKSLLLTSYGIAAATLVLNLMLTLILVNSLLIVQPADQRHTLGSELVSISSRSALIDAFNIFTIISFISTWFATILILRHYASDIGIAKFWLVTSLPLVLFFSFSQFCLISLLRTPFSIPPPRSSYIQLF